ncbi:hypothetical protein A0H81_10973 [Grifola frondosa]|uniref:RING-type domain-containing protein n=1 Tax=Grifola frondosa TaxID=5627 RepID=A0A1C7LWV4_GRIFR|nr:hypothetical protein A0H81_10973 [Grifola frondosa]
MYAQCTICLDEFTPSNSPMSTRCGHLYCVECAAFHFGQERPTCAICRKPQTMSDLIKLFPSYPSDSTSHSPRESLNGLGTIGNAEVDACLEALQADDCPTEQALYRLELYLQLHFCFEESSEGRHVWMSMAAILAQLRIKAKDSDKRILELLKEHHTLKRTMEQREANSVQQIRRQRDERRKRLQDQILQQEEMKAEMHAIEERYYVVQRELAAAREKSEKDREVLTQVNVEMKRWRATAAGYKKKYYASKAQLTSFKKLAQGDIDHSSDESLQIV